jgi:Spy/CpxP family protein refolding chaperone
MNRALAVVTVVSLFVAGIAIGALGMHIYQDRQLRHAGETRGPDRGFFTRRLWRHLDLSDDQQRKIGEILQRSREEAMDLRRDVRPQVMAIMDRAHEEIADILNPEQREEFQSLLRDNHRRAEHFFLGPPGRGHDRRGPWDGRGRRGPWGGPGRRPGPPPPGFPPADPPSDRPDARPVDPGEEGSPPTARPDSSDQLP